MSIDGLCTLKLGFHLLLLPVISTVTACSTQFAVTVNEQTVYDPRLQEGSVAVTDANLQGCINLTLRQQRIADARELTVISCASSEVVSLNGLSQLEQLRFIDLADNQVSDLLPLSRLTRLSGLSIPNNRIRDISPLFDMQSLTAVILTGNNEIPCGQLDLLEEKLQSNLTRPDRCEN